VKSERAALRVHLASKSVSKPDKSHMLYMGVYNNKCNNQQDMMETLKILKSKTGVRLRVRDFVIEADQQV
jgi:hypothetical protein